MEGAKSFYFDTALSGNEHTLGLLLGFAKAENVLFGSDFPYASLKNMETNINGFEEFEMTDEMRNRIARGNAIRLFPRLASKQKN